MDKYRKTHTSVEAFVVGGIEMVLHYLVVNDQVDIKQVPVIGWIHQRDHFADGSFCDEIHPGVIETDTKTVLTAHEVYGTSSNCEVIGVYPKDVEPSDDDISVAESALYDKLQAEWRRVEDFQEPTRSKFRAKIEVQGRALKDMIDADRAVA